MKKILLLFNFWLFFTVTNSKAQNYYSYYLDSTSEWRYFTPFASESLYTYSNYYRTIFFDGTENYNGFTYYRERFFTVVKFYNISTNNFLYQDEYYPTFYNLVREDSQGRFYRRIYNNLEVEEMYQDNIPIHNSQVGDNFPSMPDINFGTCPIVSTQQLSIAGLSLKKLLGTNGPLGGLVEGVGVLGQACNGGENNLVCYTKQGQNLIFEPGTDCSVFPVPTYLNNNSFNQNPISIYPNPTNGMVTVESNDRIDSLELWDIQGRKLITQKNKIIDLTSFQKGTYFLKIKTNNQQQTQQIIKN
jgi:hypothetical protein